jgi:hypothetical protein
VDGDVGCWCLGLVLAFEGLPGAAKDRSMSEDEKDQNDRRRNGGWFREILGTFFGAAPYVLAIVLWGTTVQERLRVSEIRLDHAEAAQKANVDSMIAARIELLQRMDKFSAQIEVLQQTVAQTVGRSKL